MPKPMFVWSGTAWVSVASEVESLATYATQSYADSTPGTRMIVPTSVSVGSGSGSVGTSGAVTFSAASSVSLNGCFTSTYDSYRLIVELQTDSFRTLNFRWRSGTTDDSNATYNYQTMNGNSTTISGARSTSQTSGLFGYSDGAGRTMFSYDILNPFTSQRTAAWGNSNLFSSTAIENFTVSHAFANTTSFTGITIYPTAGTATGTIRVYGYKN